MYSDLHWPMSVMWIRSYVSVDEHSEFEASQCLQLLAVIQGVGGQLLLHDVIGHQPPHVRSHGQTSCETSSRSVCLER